MRCEVHGHETHSALTHEGVNAVEAAAEIVAHLKSMARRKRDDGPYDPGFVPPYTTIHAGTIRGGTAVNIVPRECSFDFEVRAIAADDPHALFHELREFAETRAAARDATRSARTPAFIFMILNDTPGPVGGAGRRHRQLAQALSGANDTGKVSYTAEAGLFQAADIPAVICGPGSIEQAHKPNEFVALDQIERCEMFMRRLLEHLRA